MVNQNDAWEAQERIRFIQDALAKLHGARRGSDEWLDVVDWAVKGLLEKQLKEDRATLWQWTNGVPEIEQAPASAHPNPVLTG